MKLPKRTKRNWLAALRSGEYEQAYGVFHKITETSDTFCVMGLLDVIDPGFWVDDDDADILMEANDIHHWTFPQLADYIEVML